MITKANLESTNEKTQSGQALYRDVTTGRMFYEDSLGQLRENEAPISRGEYQASNLSGMFLLVVIAVSAGSGLWLKSNMSDTLYELLFLVLMVVFVTLPFVNGMAKKLIKINNVFLLASIYIYIVPKIDEMTGASNSSFAYLGLLIDACIAGGIAYMAYKVIRSIQRKVLKV